MELENMLVEENMTIKEAVWHLEKYRCKTVYVVENMKLKAAISDGDARRFLLKNGNIEDNVNQIANYSPTFFYENQIEQAKEVFRESGMQSVPILNYNNEIISVLFRNDVFLNKVNSLKAPVVIMAGGKGSRLYPYTKILPKALIPIGDIPITEHIINKLHAYGCSLFYMIVNHKKNMIKSYFECLEKKYSLQMVEEIEFLGTGGGLGLMKGMIKGDFFLTNCDVLVDIDYTKVFQYHKDNENFITIIAAEKCDKIPYGVLRMDEKCNYIGVIEKPENSYLINTGFYIVNSAVIEELDIDEAIGFPDIIDRYYRMGRKIGIYQIEEKAFMDMGQLEEMEVMRQKLGV